MARMPSRIAVIAIDAVRPRMVADFWCNVLGWHVVDEDDGVISIAPPDGAWPTIDVLGVAEGKAVKNRLHLDLRAFLSIAIADMAGHRADRYGAWSINRFGVTCR